MRCATQRGAAVVMAMLVVAVTATLVTGAFWRQSVIARQAENELSFAQAKWLIRGAIDWAGVILREDARTSSVDHIGEPWAVPLADTHLNPDDGRDPVYLAGAILDEQAKFNLRNLAGPKGVNPLELAVLRRLLALVGASETLADPVAERVLASVPGEGGRKQLALGLGTIDDLLDVKGVSPAALERLRPFVTVLPQPTPVNANTAPAEVLAARFENLALADARRLTASRDRAYFKDRTDVLSRIPQLKLQASDTEIAVATRFFAVDGTVSYRRARLRTQALLRREAGRVEAVWLREAV
ncbi:MAG: type II secretion system minor pseudopilin GspK [Gammaproteobacteria bacterium]